MQKLNTKHKMIFECIRGSHLYGTNTPESDFDMGGIYVADNSEWLKLTPPQGEIRDERGDVTYYELRKFITLAKTANPTVIEYFFIPDDCVKINTPTMDVFKKHRNMFVTKRCSQSFSGYAIDQIKKASGKNKKSHNIDEYVDSNSVVNMRRLIKDGKITEEWIASRFNSNIAKFLKKDGTVFASTDNTDWRKMDEYLKQPEIKKMTHPMKEDFCYFVDNDIMRREGYVDDDEDLRMPFRPNRIDNLDHYDCSAVEHIPYLIRLYRNGTGVFKNNQMVFTSISKEREWKDFVGVMSFNENDYERTKSEWHSFWEWMSNRSEERYEHCWDKDKSYDKKNMSHTVRLLLSAEHIALNGEPLIRFTGEKLQFLRDIRNGKYTYEYLIAYANEKQKELFVLFEKSSLSNDVDSAKVNDLYIELVNMEK